MSLSLHPAFQVISPAMTFGTVSDNSFAPATLNLSCGVPTLSVSSMSTSTFEIISPASIFYHIHNGNTGFFFPAEWNNGSEPPRSSGKSDA